MNTWKPLMSGHDVLKLIDTDKNITQDDRIRISSIPYHTTLVEAIGDLKVNELNEVYYLEAKNIYAVINTGRIMLGLSDDPMIFSKIINSMPPSMLSALEKPNSSDFITPNFYLLALY